MVVQLYGQVVEPSFIQVSDNTWVADWTNVTVTWVLIDTKITGDAGDYIFDNLESGYYEVVFVSPNNFRPTIRHAGNDTTLDSDAWKVSVNLDSTRTDIDGGFVPASSSPAEASVAVHVKEGESFSGANFVSDVGSALNYETHGNYTVIATAPANGSSSFELHLSYQGEDDRLLGGVVQIPAGTTVTTDITVWTGIGSVSRITAILANPFTQQPVADGSKELPVLKVRYGIGKLAGEAEITRSEIEFILTEKWLEVVSKGLESFADRYKDEIFANWRNEDPTRTTLVLEERYQHRLDAISSVLGPLLEGGVIKATAERLLRDEREFDIHIFKDLGANKETLEKVFSEIPGAAEAKRSSPLLPIAQYLKEHSDIQFAGVSTIINSEALRPIRENILSIFEDWDNPNFGAFDPTLINTLEWETIPLLSAEFKHELDFSFNGGTGTGEFRLGVSEISISKVRDVESFLRNVKATMGLTLENYVSPSQRRLRLETGIESTPFQDDVLSETNFTISSSITID